MSSGEKQYEEFKTRIMRDGADRLGVMTSWAFEDDPKRLTFTFARYKFVAKMFSGVERALEVGCGDGLVSRVVRQHVNSLTAIDFDPAFVDDARQTMSAKWPIDFQLHDIMAQPFPQGGFDAAYALDVLEHIDVNQEDRFLDNIASSLSDFGALIIGMPSLESQAYASALSKLGHVNCKTQKDLSAVMRRHFHKVFSFGMNDEVVHTGYDKMCHYIFALGVAPKRTY